MKLIASAAVVAAMLGTAAMAPAAFAQDQGPQAGPGERHQMFLRHHGGNHRFGPQMHMQRGGPGMERSMMRGGGLLALACSADGADRLEHMLLSLSQRLDPTADQQSLFEDFRTAALTAQTGFADSCAELSPEDDTAAAASPDLVERLRRHIGVGEARLTAMNEVLPALEAFYGSLTDEQKALLEPGHGKRGERHGMRIERPVSPAAPEAPELEG
jgi:hypothetical protein